MAPKQAAPKKKRDDDEAEEGQKTYDKSSRIRCTSQSVAKIFNGLGHAQNQLVQEMGFGALAHIPDLNINQTLQMELVHCFDEKTNMITPYLKFPLTSEIIGQALGLNSIGNLYPKYISEKKRKTKEVAKILKPFEQKSKL